MNFDLVDAGPLRIARYAEPFEQLLAQLAYQLEWWGKEALQHPHNGDLTGGGRYGTAQQRDRAGYRRVRLEKL